MAEVYFYFFLTVEGYEHDAYALVSLFSPPDPELMEWSYSTFWSCLPSGDNNLVVVNVKTIQSVVSMIPHDLAIDIISDPVLQERVRGRWFMVPELGADAGAMAGVQDDDRDAEDEDDEDEES